MSMLPFLMLVQNGVVFPPRQDDTQVNGSRLSMFPDAKRLQYWLLFLFRVHVLNQSTINSIAFFALNTDENRRPRDQP